MLEQANIPTPSSILTDLLVLKISQLPLDPVDKHMVDGDMFFWNPTLDSGKQLEIRMSQGGYGNIGLEAAWRYHGQHCGVAIGMPGAPAYRSVKLSSKDADRLMTAIMAWRDLYWRKRAIDENAQSEQNALVIIENLL